MNKRIYLKTMFVFLSCLIFFNIYTVFPQAMGSAVKKIATKVDPDDLSEVDSDDVFFEDGGNIYKANGKDLFIAMKKDYGSEDWTYGDETKKWENVSSSGDSMDASKFQSKIGASSGIVMTMCKNMVSSILTFGSEEMHIPLVLLKEYIAPIAFTLTVLYAMLNIGKEREKDRKSPQTIVRCLIPMVIGIVAINYSGQIFGWICDFTVGFLRDVSGKLDTATITASAGYSLDDLKEIAKSCDLDSFISSIGSAISSGMSGGLTSIAMMIVSLLLAVMCYGLKLVFGIRLMCLPLALADCTIGGFSSNSFDYIKGLLGEGISMGLIVAMIEIAGSMGANGTGIIACFAIPFSCIATFSQVKQIAKDALGTRKGW